MEITKHLLRVSLEPLSDKTYDSYMDKVILSKEEAALVKEVLLRSSCLYEVDSGAADLYAEIVEWVDAHTEANMLFAYWLSKSEEIDIA